MHKYSKNDRQFFLWVITNDLMFTDTPGLQ